MCGPTFLPPPTLSRRRAPAAPGRRGSDRRLAASGWGFFRRHWYVGITLPMVALRSSSEPTTTGLPQWPLPACSRSRRWLVLCWLGLTCPGRPARCQSMFTIGSDDASTLGGGNCTQYSATGVTTGNDVGRPVNVKTVGACVQACEATPKCCIAEFDSHIGRCYLKHAGLLVAKGRRPGITALKCGAACPGPAPPHPPPPAPAPAPPPPPAPGPPARFWDMSHHVGAEYNCCREGQRKRMCSYPMQRKSKPGLWWAVQTSGFCCLVQSRT